jgi:hypothetical protein
VTTEKKNPVNKRIELRGDVTRAVRTRMIGEHRRKIVGEIEALKVV